MSGPSPAVLAVFGATGAAAPLAGGRGVAWRAGHVVLTPLELPSATAAPQLLARALLFRLLAAAPPRRRSAHGPRSSVWSGSIDRPDFSGPEPSQAGQSPRPSANSSDGNPVRSESAQTPFLIALVAHTRSAARETGRAVRPATTVSR